MSEPKQASKQELLKMIKKLEKNPHDRIGILGEFGVAGIGAVAGGAAAAVFGATTVSVPLVTALTGISLVAAAPLALVAGAAVAGGAATYGVAQLVKGGGYTAGKQAELLRAYQDRLKDIEAKERKDNLQDIDKTNFYIFLKEPLELSLISSEDAQALIAAVENGQMPLIDAYQFVGDILQEAKPK